MVQTILAFKQTEQNFLKRRRRMEIKVKNHNLDKVLSNVYIQLNMHPLHV